MLSFKQIACCSLAVAVLGLFSCSKDDDKDPQPGDTPNPSGYICETCVKSSEGNPAFDESSRGIYKGIVVGSSGVLKLNIANNGVDVSAVLIMDGDEILLNSAQGWSEFDPLTLSLSGIYKGETITIDFWVRGDGTDAQIPSAIIPGHSNVTIEIAKETSDLLIEGFEGKYERNDGKKGVFNILLSRKIGKWGGLARENGSSDYDDINGHITDGKIFDEDGTELGVLKNDLISGSFTDSKGRKVTIEAKRSL